MSVVARPACARTGGRKLKRNRAATPTGPAVIPPAPGVDRPAGDPEEGKYSESRGGQGRIVIVAVEDGDPFLGHRQELLGVGALAAKSQEIGAERRGDPRQRRMLRLPPVYALVQPLHAASDVGRLVGSMTEDRVSRYNPQRTEDNQRDGQQAASPFQKSGDTLADVGRGFGSGSGLRRRLLAFCLPHGPPQDCSSSSSSFSCTSSAVGLSGAITRMVSSPAMVPTTSRPLFVVERHRHRVGVAGRGLQDHQVLRAQHVLQELGGQQARTAGPVSSGAISW